MQVHQRVPLFVGSKAEVEYLESLLYGAAIRPPGFGPLGFGKKSCMLLHWRWRATPCALALCPHNNLQCSRVAPLVAYMSLRWVSRSSTVCRQARPCALVGGAVSFCQHTEAFAEIMDRRHTSNGRHFIFADGSCTPENLLVNTVKFDGGCQVISLIDCWSMQHRQFQCDAHNDISSPLNYYRYQLNRREGIVMDISVDFTEKCCPSRIPMQC